LVKLLPLRSSCPFSLADSFYLEAGRCYGIGYIVNSFLALPSSTSLLEEGLLSILGNMGYLPETKANLVKAIFFSSFSI
jgi:hypothetical protein